MNTSIIAQNFSFPTNLTVNGECNTLQIVRACNDWCAATIKEKVNVFLSSSNWVIPTLAIMTILYIFCRILEDKGYIEGIGVQIRERMQIIMIILATYIIIAKWIL